MFKKKGKKKIKQNKLDRLLEMPVEISSNEPKVTITSFKEMLIENYKAILEYQDFFVRISTHIGIVNINGFDLKLEEMTTDDLKIKGKIEGIDFENTVDEEE